jgi:hypothetical protein
MVLGKKTDADALLVQQQAAANKQTRKVAKDFMMNSHTVGWVSFSTVAG